MMPYPYLRTIKYNKNQRIQQLIIFNVSSRTRQKCCLKTYYGFVNIYKIDNWVKHHSILRAPGYKYFCKVWDYNYIVF